MRKAKESENGSNDEWIHRILATTGLETSDLSDEIRNAILATVVAFLEDHTTEIKERVMALANEGMNVQVVLLYKNDEPDGFGFRYEWSEEEYRDAVDTMNLEIPLLTTNRQQALQKVSEAHARLELAARTVKEEGTLSVNFREQAFRDIFLLEFLNHIGGEYSGIIVTKMIPA